MKLTMILLVVLLASCGGGGGGGSPANNTNTQDPIQSNNTLDWDNSIWNDSNWK